jgi:hypothetical protein
VPGVWRAMSVPQRFHPVLFCRLPRAIGGVCPAKSPGYGQGFCRIGSLGLEVAPLDGALVAIQHSTTPATALTLHVSRDRGCVEP